MPTNIWRGGAATVAQVSTATPANVEVGDGFSLTITDDLTNTHAIAFTATATTVANVCTGLTAAWLASGDAWWRGVTVADSTTHVTITSNTAGAPFALTSGTTNVGGGAATQTLTVATPTASSGPNDYNIAANWSLGAVPVAADHVIVASGAPSILYGLDQSGIDLGIFEIEPGYTGNVGRWGSPTPGYGVAQLFPLKLNFSVADNGTMRIDGSGTLCAIDTGTNICTITVKHTGTPANGQHCVYITGQEIKYRQHSGDAIIDAYGETTIMTATAFINGGSLVAGSGCDFDVQGAEVYNATFAESNSAGMATTVKVFGGATYRPRGAISPAVTVYDGGTLDFDDGPTVTALATYDGATVTAANCASIATVTNWTHYGATTVVDPTSRIVYTNPPTYPYLG